MLHGSVTFFPRNLGINLSNNTKVRLYPLECKIFAEGPDLSIVEVVADGKSTLSLRDLR
jgi:hypothetical protein